ncbi:unnamed protein product [Cunninghamella blakesleeana]
MISLKGLLDSQNLQVYYQPLLDVGVIDNDLPFLIHLNDNELNELLQAVKMLPFHSIKMKKAIREIRNDTTEQLITTTINKPNTNDTSLIKCNKKEMDQATILSHAIIYGKNTKRQLTNYEIAINQASVELALQDTSLLIQKGKLFELAKKKLLDEGYTYKRGKSRSKLSNQMNHAKSSSSMSINHYHSNNNNNNNNNSNHSLSPKEKSNHQLDNNNNNNNNNKAMTLIKKHQKRSDKAQKQSKQRHELIHQLEIELRQMRASIRNIKSIKSLSIHEQYEREELIKKKKSTSMEISKLKAQERKHQWYKRKCQNKLSSSPSSSSLSYVNDEEKESKSILEHLHHEYSTMDLPKSPINNNNNNIPTPSSPTSSSSSPSLTLSPLSSPTLSISPLSLPSSSYLLTSPSYYHLPPLLSKQHQDHQHPYSNMSSIRESDIRGKALSVKDFCT